MLLCPPETGGEDKLDCGGQLGRHVIYACIYIMADGELRVHCNKNRKKQVKI